MLTLLSALGPSSLSLLMSHHQIIDILETQALLVISDCFLSFECMYTMVNYLGLV